MTRKNSKGVSRPKQATLPQSAYLAAAFNSDEAWGNAAVGIWKNGGVLDAAFDLAQELNVMIFHPEVFPSVLKVILRDAQPIAAVRVPNLRKWLEAHPAEPRPWMVRDYLRRMERAVREGK
jgi:hypothetical protein